jgi:hypothetical protein
LAGEPASFAKSGQRYPFFIWTSKIDRVTVDEIGQFGFFPQDKLTAQLGEGVSFKPARYEVWDGSVVRAAGFDVVEKASEDGQSGSGAILTMNRQVASASSKTSCGQKKTDDLRHRWLKLPRFFIVALIAVILLSTTLWIVSR